MNAKYTIEMMKYKEQAGVSLLMLSLSLLSACSSLPRGESFTDCGPWLFGIAQASKNDTIFASYQETELARNRCLTTSYAKGFDLFDPPLDAKFTYRANESNVDQKPVRKVAIPTEKNDDVANARHSNLHNFSVRSTQYSFTFDSAGNWQESASPSPLYQAFAKNVEGKAALYISVYDANPFLIWSDARDSLYQRNRDQLVYSDLTKIKEFTINERLAFQIEYRGRDKHDVPLHFLSTQIRFGKKLVYLTSWSFEEDYAKNEADFHRIANSLSVQARWFSGTNALE